LFDAIVVEEGESDGRLANSANTDESEWSEAFARPTSFPINSSRPKKSLGGGGGGSSPGALDTNIRHLVDW